MTSQTQYPDVAERWSRPRDSSTARELSNDCLGAISRCETGTRGNVRESAMRTVAGVAASYASAGQHIAVKTIATLQKMKPEQLGEWGLTQNDLKNAERVCFGVRNVWKEATADNGAKTVAELRSKVEDKALRLSRLTDDDLTRLLRGAQMFRELRAAIEAAGELKGEANKTKRNEVAKAFYERSPLPKALDIRESDLRIYIRSGFGEDLAAWQRLALEKPPLGEADDRLGARIKAAAEARGGWLLPLIDMQHALENTLASDPEASDVEVLRAVVHNHAQNPRPEYLEKATNYFVEIRANRKAGTPWTIPGDDAASAQPAAQPAPAQPAQAAPLGSLKEPCKLGGSVGRGGDNRPDDVQAIVLRLRQLGHIGERVDGSDVAKLVEGIKHFQTTRAGFHRGDGRIDPGGKTLSALNDAIAMS